MLSFDIRALEAQAASVDDQLSTDDGVWEEGDPRPDSGIRVTGRLSAAGTGGFYWHGRISGDVSCPCRRCLGEAHAHIDEESQLIFAEQTEDNADDPDVYLYDPTDSTLDLRPAIREQWLLAQPGFVVCRPDCKGLCPKCGADLAVESCACPPQTDSRWDDLRKANA